MEQPRTTKKERIIRLFDRGFDVESISDALATSPSYVANTLIAAGRSVEYDDLYTTTSGRGYSPEARKLSGILRFRDVEAAMESVRRLDEVYQDFKRSGNRIGQHRAQMLALTGKNRALGIGKLEEANIFREWLIRTLSNEREDQRDQAA